MDKELKIRVVFDTGKATTETKQFAEGSIGALEQSLRKAKLAMKDLTIGTEQHTAALVKLKQLEAEVRDGMGRGFIATKNLASGSANAAVTLQALNYTVRDSPYFFRDFSLGVLAVGNNLNPLIDGFIRMKQETGSVKGAMSALLGTLKGPAGIIFIFSLIVTAIQAVTFTLAKNKTQTDENKKSFEDISRSIKEYTATLQDAERSEFDLLKKRKENFAAEIEIEKAKLMSKYGIYAWKPELMGTPEQKAYQAEFDTLEKRKKAMDDLVTDPLINAYMQRQTMVFELAAIYSDKTLTKIIELNGINKNILNSIVQSAERELNMTDTTNEKYEERKRIFDRLKASYGELFGKEPKDKKEPKEIYAENIIDSMKDKALSAENELQRFKIANMQDSLDKDIAAIELKYKIEKEKFEQTIRDEQQALEKLRKDKKLAPGELEKATVISGEFVKTLNISIEQLAIEKIDAIKKAELDETEKGEKKLTTLIDIFENEKIRLTKTTSEKILAEIENRYRKIFEKIKELEKENPEAASMLRALFGTLKDLEIDKVTSDKGTIKRRKLEEEAQRQGKSVDELNESLSKTDSLATQVGNSLFQAFTEGYFASDKFLASLLAIAAQLVIVEGLKYIFSGGVSGIFGILGFAQGGIVGKASYGYVIPGQSYSGDKIPIMANSGEMVLDLTQQQNLLKLLSTPVSGYNQMMMGRMDAMNMNMASGQPTILIQTDIDGLKFTKRTINPAQAKLIRGNVISAS